MPIEITNVGIKGPKGDTGPSGAPLQAYSGVPIKLITPASTFTGITVSDNGAGKVLLTGAGAHGLSAADAVGANIFILTASTGWTGLAIYKIISLDADVTGNKIGIDLAFASQAAPIMALGSVIINYILSAIAPLGPNSIIKADALVSLKNSANPKSLSYRSLALKMSEVNNLVNISSYRYQARIHMRGTNQSQIGLADNMVGGFGPSTNNPVVSALDFSVTRNFALALGMYATEPITIESYLVEVYNL
ncbi:hypothetical protein [Nitrosomonas communis]|uniref:Uncharacterized protein n=1 Tax=Nitrosomonas communis TaxID=44574 RepID=A0A1I4UV50_9PROT|nr:hypothetical protein [Nitrosomonas communis]SFM92859.1 hypothetical protein SAMN05421863_107113 [Nitrosomonas communis]